MLDGREICSWLEGIKGERERKKEKKKTKLVVSSSRDTYIDELGVVALSQIVQDGRVVEVSQIGHVFNFFEFRRIDRKALVFLEMLFLCLPISSIL